MPLGNGDLVAMAWANATSGGLGCYIRKADAMSGSTELLTLGLLQVALSPNPFEDGDYFNQTLQLATASVVILAGGTSLADHRVRLEIWADANHNVLRLAAAAAAAGSGTKYSLRADLTPIRPLGISDDDGASTGTGTCKVGA